MISMVPMGLMAPEAPATPEARLCRHYYPPLPPPHHYQLSHVLPRSLPRSLPRPFPGSLPRSSHGVPMIGIAVDGQV